jgi:hypothetical protein
MKPVDICTITNLVLNSTISVPYGYKRVAFKVVLRFFFDKKELLQILKSDSPPLILNVYLRLYRLHIYRR